MFITMVNYFDSSLIFLKKKKKKEKKWRLQWGTNCVSKWGQYEEDLKAKIKSFQFNKNTYIL